MNLSATLPTRAAARRRIVFVDYGGTPYAALCAHLARGLNHDLDVAHPMVVGESSQSVWQLLTVRWRFARHGVPLCWLVRERVNRNVRGLLADQIVAIDQRTRDALIATGRVAPERVLQLTNWKAYRMPTHNDELIDALVSDLASRLPSVLECVTA